MTVTARDKYHVGEKLLNLQGEEVEVIEYMRVEGTEPIVRVKRTDGDLRETFRHERALRRLDDPPACEHMQMVAIIPVAEARQRGLIDENGVLLCACNGEAPAKHDFKPYITGSVKCICGAWSNDPVHNAPVATLTPEAEDAIAAFEAPDMVTETSYSETGNLEVKHTFPLLQEQNEAGASAAMETLLPDGAPLFAIHAPEFVVNVVTGETKGLNVTANGTLIKAVTFDHNCTLCPLHGRAQTVCVAGRRAYETMSSETVPVEVMIVGQNPGAEEDEQGRPFVGKTGELLTQLLDEAGLRQDYVYITNAVKCLTTGNRAPNKKERNACATYLINEIAQMRPKVIIVFGNTALELVTGQTKITPARGKAASFSAEMNVALERLGVQLDQGVEGHYDPYILPTIHPSSIIHSPKGPQVREQILGDLKLARQQAVGGFAEIAVPWRWCEKPAPDLKKTIDATPELDKQVWGADLETNGLPLWHPGFRIGMISIDTGYDPVEVFRGPFVLNALEALRHSLEKGVTLVGHNWSMYDRAGIEERTKLNLRGDDTMLIEHLLNEDGPKGLEEVAVRRLHVRPWKDELPENCWSRMTAGEFSDEEWDRLGTYNARDSRYCRLVFLDQMTEMAQDLQLFNYYKAFFLPFSRALSRIERNGIYVDLDKIQKAWGKYSLQKTRGETAARLLVGDMDFNPGSSKQVHKVLFDDLRLPAQQWTDGGVESTNEYSLKKLKYLVETDPIFADKPGVPALVNSILDYREATKKEGTYLEPYAAMALASPIAQRIFPSYSLVTSVSRTASFNPNTQNRPRDLDIIGAPPGFVTVHADASQLELRTIAHCSQSEPMIEALRAGKDLHAELAMAIRKLRGDPHPEAFTPEERSRAKPGNFGFGYGADEYTFEVIALKDYDMVIPRAESTLIRDAFHQRWQLRPWYERQFQEAMATGQVRSPSGRVRRLPAINSADPKVRLEALRQAINFPAQELGLTMWGCVLLLAVQMGLKVTQEIHDSLDIEVPECTEHPHALPNGKINPGTLVYDCAVAETAKKLRAIEETLPSVLKNTFGIELLVPFVLDIEIKS